MDGSGQVGETGTATAGAVTLGGTGVAADGGTARGWPASDEDPAQAGWREADRTLRDLARRRATLDVEEARWLVKAREAGVHVHLGFGSFLEYVERVLGYAPHSARERLRVAEALCALPATCEAMAAGRVTYSAVRELTRVAVPETEEAWLDVAVNRTVREVEDRVRGRRPGDGPEAPPDPDARTHTLRLELSPATMALFLAAQRYLQRASGHMLDDDDVVAALCRGMLADAATAPEVAGSDRDDAGMTAGADAERPFGGAGAAADDRGGGPAAEGTDGAERQEGDLALGDAGRRDTVRGARRAGHRDAGRPPYQIAITTCADCGRVWHDVAGRTIEATIAEFERACCDAELIGRVDGATVSRATTTIPPAVRRAVLRRDRGRCVVPGCRNARHLDVHHVIWRCAGGDHAPLRLITLCTSHHAAIHDGRLTVSGEPPHDLRFEFSGGHPYGVIDLPVSP